jgi:hypothetical protein
MRAPNATDALHAREVIVSLPRIVLWALVWACPAAALAQSAGPVRPGAGDPPRTPAPSEGGPTVAPTDPAVGPPPTGAPGPGRAGEPGKTPAPTEGGPTVAPTSPEVGDDAPRGSRTSDATKASSGDRTPAK